MFLSLLLTYLSIVMAADGPDSCTKKSTQQLDVDMKGKTLSWRSSDKAGMCHVTCAASFGCDGQCTVEGRVSGVMAGDANKTENDIKVSLLSVQEVAATAASDGTWTVNKVVQKFDIGKYAFGDLGCTCDGAPITTTCMGGKVVCTQTSTKGDGGVLVATYTFVGKIAMLGVDASYQLDPQTVKMDLSVTSFPFTSTSNYLAIEAALSTKSAVTDASTQTKGVVHVRGMAAATGGGLYWAQEFATDASAVPSHSVVATSRNKMGDDNHVTFVFTQAGSDVYWDPEVRFESSASIASMSLLALVVMVITTFM